jgi:hypothetical protein
LVPASAASEPLRDRVSVENLAVEAALVVLQLSDDFRDQVEVLAGHGDLLSLG